ncbi:MAG: C40 family peptidase [Actinomycetota bacterium]|nr:C40 family peptidase [Actinomycetota bacterium]
MRSTRTIIGSAIAAAVILAGLPLANVTAAPRADIEQVRSQVRDLEMKAAGATEEARYARARLQGIQQDLGGIQRRAARERDELNVAVSTLDDLARATYVAGGLDPTLEVLMAEDPSEFLAQAAVLAQLEQTQIGQVRAAQTTKLRLAQTEAQIVDREAAASDVSAEMAAAQEEADAALAQAQDVLAGLEEEERRRLAQLEEERRQQQRDEAAAAAAAQPGYNGGGSSGSGRAAAAVQYALAQVGEPYSFSAQPPDSWDCSKLTAAAWGSAGVGLTALSYTQWDQTQRVPTSDIQPGDLVFYFGLGAHHVAIYIGGGKMVSASNPGDGVEIIDYLGPWYAERFSGIGRVVT